MTWQKYEAVLVAVKFTNIDTTVLYRHIVTISSWNTSQSMKTRASITIMYASYLTDDLRPSLTPHCPTGGGGGVADDDPVRESAQHEMFNS